MTWLRWVGGVLAVPLGVASEVAAGEWLSPLGTVDLVAGLAFVWCGLSIRERPVRVLMVACGVTWFAGNFATPLLFIHRAPLVHLLVGRPWGWPARIVVGAVYVAAVAYPLGHNDWVWATLSVAILGTVLVGYVRSTKTERRARVAGLAGGVAIGVVLGLGAAARLAGAGGAALVLWAYELTVIAVALLVFADHRWRPWRRATVTGLALDLGELEHGGAQQARLAAALGDPSARLVYWVPATGSYVDIAGQPVAEFFLHAEPNRVLTALEHDGDRLGALVHDASVAKDDALVADIAALASVALVNARLQAAVRAGVAEVDASRRRIIEAADVERRRLERELRDGAERRLLRAEELLASGGDEYAELRELLAGSLAELDGFARGVHPRTLFESGLAAALTELAVVTRLPVELDVLRERLPPEVEVAAYFVCAEAMTNALKHAAATAVLVRVRMDGDRLCVEVGDDGVGGADPGLGSGLHGLADRVAALGGTLRVDTAPAAGTRVVCAIPI